MHTGCLQSSRFAGAGSEAQVPNGDGRNQAQGLLEGNIYRGNDAIVQHNDNFPNDRKSYGDQFVSTEAVIAVARQLNEFVNEK